MVPNRCATDTSDDMLVARCHQGEEEALNLLLERYRRFARAKARGYFLVGGDLDDIEQEGMIGLFKAVRDYRCDREASFRAFAELCITRQIISAIKSASRQKHRPLNQYVSLWGLRLVDDPGGGRLIDELPHHQVPDPADELVVLGGPRRHQGLHRQDAVGAGGRGAAALRRRQVLPGDRRAARAPRQVHRQRPPAHQAQAREPPGGTRDRAGRADRRGTVAVA